MAKVIDYDANELQKRIKVALDGVGKSARGASLEAGLGASTIRNILEGRSGFPRVNTINAIAEVLGCSPNWLLGGITKRDQETDEDLLHYGAGLAKRGVKAKTSDPDLIAKGGLIPLYVPSLSGGGVWALTVPTTIKIELPYFTSPHEDIYAVMVRDRVMEPKYKFDSIILIDPNLGLVKGEDYIFFDSVWTFLGGDTHSMTGFIAKLEDYDDEFWIISQYAIEGVREVPRIEWKEPDAIMGALFRTV